MLAGETSALRCKAELDAASQKGALAICGPVYAELCAFPGVTEDLANRFLADACIEIDFLVDEPAWRESGRRFAKYAARRRKSAGGSPKRMLMDFIVGAHALLKTDCLVTQDEDRYAKDFPDLKLVTP